MEDLATKTEVCVCAASQVCCAQECVQGRDEWSKLYDGENWLLAAPSSQKLAQLIVHGGERTHQIIPVWSGVVVDRALSFFFCRRPAAAPAQAVDGVERCRPAPTARKT